MADVTYYVAMPFLQDDAGSPVAGAAEECQSSSAALRRAEVLSRMPGSKMCIRDSEEAELLLGLHALGDDRHLQAMAEADHGPDDRSRLRIASEIDDEGAVDLDLVERKGLQIACLLYTSRCV